MYATSSNTLTDRFAWLTEGLCKAIVADAQKQGINPTLAWASWNRVRLLGARFIVLADRVEAGKRAARVVLTKRRVPGDGPGPAEARPAGGPRAPRFARVQCKAAASLPREFGWMRRLLPETAEYAGALRFLCLDPELAALLERTPRAGLPLRQLCHLLGVEPPAPLPRGVRPAGEIFMTARAPLAAEAGPQQPFSPASARARLTVVPFRPALGGPRRSASLLPAWRSGPG